MGFCSPITRSAPISWPSRSPGFGLVGISASGRRAGTDSSAGSQRRYTDTREGVFPPFPAAWIPRAQCRSLLCVERRNAPTRAVGSVHDSGLCQERLWAIRLVINIALRYRVNPRDCAMDSSKKLELGSGSALVMWAMG